MTARRLLFLDSLSLTAYRWQPGGPRIEATFTSDEAGLAAFADFLQLKRGSLYYLLADVAEEGFQIEDVPYVSGSDRQEMLKRKLAQYFYGTPLSLAMSLGRAKIGRRDEKVLFAGLTGYLQFEPWLDAMRSAEAQLAGIFTVPFLLARIVGKLARNQEQVLLMTVTRAGLRQTFFDHGQLRFSRLTPMATGMVGDLATGCATETRKIYQYLAGQRLIPRDAPLPTLILAHPNHFGIIGDRCQSTPERQVQMVDLLVEAKRQGLKETPVESCAETLFLHLLAKQTPHEQFAPPAELRSYRRWQTRIGLNTAAGGVLAAGLLYTGIQMATHVDLVEGNDALKAEVDLGQRRYNAMLQGLPPVPIGFDSLRALTDRYQLLNRRSPGPEPLLQHISQAMNKAPRIELTRLEWWIANSPDDPAAGARKTASSAPAASGYGFAVVRLYAQLPLAMASDQRGQLDAVNAFAESLRGPDTQVQVVTLPFETESGKSIKSGETGGQIDPPRFVVKLTRTL
ncbi:MAG TPA: hypothetical protein VMC81_05380 [Rhodocyclaceae bacterium]|nr:hypothetical protein [Rhodocyclaceae bacterium]